jgi:hypothetical protein
MFFIGLLNRNHDDGGVKPYDDERYQKGGQQKRSFSNSAQIFSKENKFDFIHDAELVGGLEFSGGGAAVYQSDEDVV